MTDDQAITDLQLRMFRPDLHDLPAIDLPAGYALRHYRPGDEAGLTETLQDAFAEPSMAIEWAVLNNNGFMPARSWLIERDDGQIVASASMLLDPNCLSAHLEGAAFLHWVAARKSEVGKRLGYWVCLAVLHRMVLEGYRAAGLGTDDNRFPAIKTYLNLGFAPRLVADNQRDRWRKIFENLGMAEEADRRFGPLLAGPLYEF